MLGSLGNGTTFKANSLWKEAGKDIYVNIRVRDMAIFKFPSRQPGNNSYWCDSGDLDYRVMDREKTVLSQEEAKKEGVKDFSARLFVIPNSPNTVHLWLAVSPFSKEDLKTMGPTTWNRPGFPQVPLNLGGGSARVTTVPMVVKEDEGAGWGLGTLPLVEWLSAEDPIIPSISDYRIALSNFMRAVEGPNNKGAKTITNALQDSDEQARVVTMTDLWPEVKESREVHSGRNRMVFTTSNCSNIRLSGRSSD